MSDKETLVDRIPESCMEGEEQRWKDNVVFNTERSFVGSSEDGLERSKKTVALTLWRKREPDSFYAVLMKGKNRWYRTWRSFVLSLGL